MAEIAIGIDLGTSNSCVARAEDGTVDVLANAYGEKITASVVAFREDGSITVGNSAKANIIHDPENTVSSAKRLIGRYFFSEEVKKARAICAYEILEAEGHGLRIGVRNEAFSLPEISAMVLRELKSVAEARLGQPVSKAVITVPAYFNDNQRQATKDAGRIAGLDVLRIINEPTAAALAYGFGKGLKQRVAVYDLGGGTFDISVLEIGEDVFEVLSTCGDTFLGGDDFDDRLIDMLADEFMSNTGINLRNDRFALEKLKLASEDAKKALSVDSSVDIRIPEIIEGPKGMLSVEHHLTSAEFGSLVNDLLQRTFKVCDEAIQEAGVVARDLDGVVLVGGPTRLPIIRDSVRAYFQMEPKTDVDPDLVVAMGAAIHASSLINPTNDAFLLDVTPLSLRIGVAGGLAESVIDRNTPVPIEQTRTFTTFKDHQESVAIRIYQGESREADENETLGQFEFSGFAKARRGEVEIDVTFEIDTDGIVNVTARDRTTGHEASTRITLSSGLSESEIQNIIERANTDRVDTATLDEPDTRQTLLSNQRSELEEALSRLPLTESQRALEPAPAAEIPDEPRRAAPIAAPAAALLTQAPALVDEPPPTAPVAAAPEALLTPNPEPAQEPQRSAPMEAALEAILRPASEPAAEPQRAEPIAAAPEALRTPNPEPAEEPQRAEPIAAAPEALRTPNPEPAPAGPNPLLGVNPDEIRIHDEPAPLMTEPGLSSGEAESVASAPVAESIPAPEAPTAGPPEEPEIAAEPLRLEPLAEPTPADFDLEDEPVTVERPALILSAEPDFAGDPADAEAESVISREPLPAPAAPVVETASSRDATTQVDDIPAAVFDEAPTDELIAYRDDPASMDLDMDLEPDIVDMEIDIDMEIEVENEEIAAVAEIDGDEILAVAAIEDEEIVVVAEIDDDEIVELTDDLHIASAATAGELHDAQPEELAGPELTENPRELFEPAGTDLTTLSDAEDEKD